MPVVIKAIVFKTTQLKSTKVFFENILKFQIKESSPQHFVIHTKSIRLVFVDSQNGLDVEMYVQNQPIHNTKKLGATDIKRWKDPNGITIVTTSNT